MKKHALFVADLFTSIQGEGPKIGTPSIFLRLGICNLQCSWCDTPYTWKKGWTDYQLRENSWIIKKIAQLKKHADIGNIVITGGEPLLQQNEICHLLQSPVFRNMEIEFETNGSMKLLPCLKLLLPKRKISFNISPKLADSGNKPYPLQIYPNSILKFVYVSKKSEQMVDEFLKKNRLIKNLIKNQHPTVPIVIMPEGTNIQTMARNTKNIMAYCAKNGFRFSPRLHIYLFGNTRAT